MVLTQNLVARLFLGTHLRQWLHATFMVLANDLVARDDHGTHHADGYTLIVWYSQPSRLEALETSAML